jgi:hypothetical protein
MIMCGSGMPDEATIQSAIIKSNGNQQRSVVFWNTTDRPK